MNELHALILNMIIDIILINETHHNPNIYLKHQNFITHINDLQPIRGSSAHRVTGIIVVHRRIPHQSIHLPTTLQSISIKIKANNFEILISSVYKPSKAILDSDGPEHSNFEF